MGCRVPNNFQALGIFGGQYSQVRVVFNKVTGVNHFAIDLACQGGFCQTCPNRERNLSNSQRRGVFANRAIRQSDFKHVRYQWVLKERKSAVSTALAKKAIFP
jgi:hypothetical protein